MKTIRSLLSAVLFSFCAAAASAEDASVADFLSFGDATNGVRIARFPVTNGDYAKFVKETGRRPPQYWKDGAFPAGRERHPVLWVALRDAEAYCAWLGAKDSEHSYRLPTKDEWEAAAGPTPRDAEFNSNAVIARRLLAEDPGRLVEYVHPKSVRKGEKDKLSDVISLTPSGGVRGWVDHANYTGFIYTDLFKEISDAGGGTTPVDAYAQTKSACGALDMWGNCWEWTSTEITASNGAERGQKVNAIKGGSWYANRRSCLTDFQGEGRRPDGHYNTVGFRVVQTPKTAASLRERMENRLGPHILDHAEAQGRDDERIGGRNGRAEVRAAQLASAHETLADIRYAEKREDLPPDDPDQDRTLDIHIPNGTKPANGWPVVVFIHGGGFSSGSKAPTRGVGPIFDALLARGYAVVSIDYLLVRKNERGASGGDRRGMKDGFPPGGRFDPLFERAVDEAATDAALALRWLDARAADYGLDRSSVAAMGGSAGAITALYATFAKRAPNVRAVVNCWGGVADVALLDDPSIPVFTIHGDKDDTINVCYGRGIQKRMEELGSTASRLVVLEGRGHAEYGHVARNLMDDIAAFLGAALATPLAAQTTTTTPKKEQSSMDNAIYRIAEIEVKPEFLDAYLAAAATVGATSVREEPGVLCIFPMQDAEKPTSIRILEIYRDEAAYKSHLETPHFLAYKTGTPHMIESLRLAPMRPLDATLPPDVFRKITPPVCKEP